jgi:hypothetical protein
MSRPASTGDLRPRERTFLAAMTRLGFGRFEFVRIEQGEIVLDPWPTAVRDVKFGSTDPGTTKRVPAEFALKPQVAELFQYVRSVDSGEIRTLEVKSGLPFSMEIDDCVEGGRRG